MSERQPILGSEEENVKFYQTKSGRIWICLAVVLIVSVLVVVLSIVLSQKHNNQPEPNSQAACPAKYTGRFCDEPVCQPMCHQGVCVHPDTCYCDLGWTGNICDVAICDYNCSSHGNCTVPYKCTCENGWQGLECEKPYAPGFQLHIIYVYNMSLSYAMKSDIAMNTNETPKSKGIDNWGFFSDVNITFSVSAVLRDKDSSICVLRILNATCFSNTKNKTITTFKNLTCNQDSANSLLHIKVIFSQNVKTGKILKVYYNNDTIADAHLVSRMLRFIDFEIRPLDSTGDEKSYVNRKPIILVHTSSKYRNEMQCYYFNRTIKTDKFTTNREEKKVCMGKAGSPEIITMMEVFQIGQDTDLGEGPADRDDTNLAPIPSFKGHVTALGSLASMTRMEKYDAKEEMNNVQNMLKADDTIFSAIDELAFKTVQKQNDYKNKDFLEDMKKIINHEYPNRRLSLGIELIRKTVSAFSIIKKMIFSQSNLDKESRSLLIAMLGASGSSHGEKILLEMLDAEETIKGDHYLALGAMAQLLDISEHLVYAIQKVKEVTLDEDVKIRSILVLGVLGSKGLQQKTIPILSETLFNNDVRHDEKCALISALGNTHSVNAFKPLAKVLTCNETYYRILGIRALRNIPGQDSYQLVLQRLLKTRNKNEAFQCLKTLAVKGKWLTPNDSKQIVNIARDSKDIDVFYAVKNMFLDLQKHCITNHKKINIVAQITELDHIERKHYIKRNTHKVIDLKKESQNLGVYLPITIDSQVRGSEYDFNSNASLDAKVFGRRVTLVTVGTASSLVKTNTFLSTAFMTLNLFGKDYDLFLKTWKSDSVVGLTGGNPCKADNGDIKTSPSEYFTFNVFKFVYGFFGIATLNFNVDLSGPVSFGYGLNFIGNEGEMYPYQINVVAQPQANITANFNVSVSTALIEVGVGGHLDVLSGSLKANVALNLPNLTFCHFLHVDATMLSGSIYIHGKIGFSFFSTDFCEPLFDWVGARLSSTVSESFCCPSVYLTNSQDPNLLSATKPPHSMAADKNVGALVLLNTTHLCYHSRNFVHCSSDLVEHLFKNGVYIFKSTMSVKLYSEIQLLFQTRIFPILTTGYGDWYGLNELGKVIQINEIGQFTALEGSLANILADLAYGLKSSEIGPRRRYDKEHLKYTPCEFESRLTTKVLNLRPYCSKMQAVCENIKIGKEYHLDVMVFLENPSIIALNNKEACSKYVQTHGIRYPYYCDAYPFSFTLQGGKGATVMKANVMERNVKMEAIKAFIADYDVKGGDSFVVMV